MLTRLSIRNIVLIEALDLDFAGGLCVLTGETGAGKSILLDALGLVLGERADSGLVRTGEGQASVTACFEFTRMPEALATVLAAADIVLEAGEPLILRRQLRAVMGEGGTISGFTSRGFVNDAPVSVGLLRELAPFLVELHGQHDDRGLVNPRGHRGLLDRYAGAVGDALAVEAAWRAQAQARTALAEARERIARTSADRALLEAHLAELEALAPQVGEEEELALARATMQKGEKLAGDLAEIQRLWAGSDSPLAAMRLAVRRLDRIAGEHELLAQALDALDRAMIEAGEAEVHLEGALEALAHDPLALDRIETRLFDLRAVARKHGCVVDDLPKHRQALRAELAAIENGEADIAALEARMDRAMALFRERAEALSARRRLAAARLDRAVAAELVPLRLDAARFQTAVAGLSEDRWGPGGVDMVEFLIATNPGADFAGLGRIASGGELSRFILALKVALAEKGGAACVIFDEIDRGVGGAVASAIGERLARLAGVDKETPDADVPDRETGQLLAVTHSPQVAARGRRHYFIAKSSDGLVTRTSVALLDQAGRRQEIARMLSGAEITPEAIAQAERLME